MFTKFLINKSALITGSTSGIGLGIAKQLVYLGCNVVLHGICYDNDSANQMLAIKNEVQEINQDAKVELILTDLSMESGVNELVSFAHQCFGTIDIVINNAGIQYLRPIELFEPEMWDKIMNIMAKASFMIIQKCIGGMRTKQWGRIINISSVHGLVASVERAAYVSAKHALVGLTKLTALETAKNGITCNAICPGFVRTALIDEQIKRRQDMYNITKAEAEKKLLSEKQPSERFVEIQEIAALISFLCSDLAQSITGTAIPIDGGWTAQ